ncbi:Rossmann-fold NAD(P)-binding domain-containing protein [Actinacidiphila soli]|uniref:hypothetical protein n=1 Tax=Actinacidiphila soli TaxID=2487275 RepID=UPI001F0CAEB8|nr:hypothetical protein [Actinacidiphila soli]
MNTDLSAWTGAPKISAASVAEQTMQALANGWVEVPADEDTRQVKAALSQPLTTEPTSDSGVAWLADARDRAGNVLMVPETVPISARERSR